MMEALLTLHLRHHLHLQPSPQPTRLLHPLPPPSFSTSITIIRANFPRKLHIAGVILTWLSISTFLHFSFSLHLSHFLPEIHIYSGISALHESYTCLLSFSLSHCFSSSFLSSIPSLPFCSSAHLFIFLSLVCASASLPLPSLFLLLRAVHLF